MAAPLWAAFLRNHRDVIVAMDFFTVPTLTFRVLYCFFVIEHGRRRIVHFSVTEHPTGPWIVQQLMEAFPGLRAYRYMILDRDNKFGVEVTDLLRAGGMKPRRISLACPWRMEYRNAGSEVVAESFLITWSSSMTFICAVRSGITFPIIMRTGSMTRLRKTHRRSDLFLLSRTNLRNWFHSRASVACIIDTTGDRLPEEPLSSCR